MKYLKKFTTHNKPKRPPITWHQILDVVAFQLVIASFFINVWLGFALLIVGICDDMDRRENQLSKKNNSEEID